MEARLRTAYVASDRRSTHLLGLAWSGTRDHPALVRTSAAVRGGPLGRRRVRAEGHDPPDQAATSRAKIEVITKSLRPVWSARPSTVRQTKHGAMKRR